MEFPKFWYESNACWGYVNSFAELAEKVKLQLNGHSSIVTIDDFLDKSRQSEYSELDFGTRREHSQSYTLREFLVHNEILDDFLAYYNNIQLNDNNNEHEQ